jgi:hypothetical protein
VAIRFDNSADYVERTASLPSIVTSTFGAWVCRRVDQNTDTTIFVVGTDAFHFWYISAEADGDDFFCGYWNGSSGALTSKVTLPIDTWKYIAAVVNAGTLRFYSATLGDTTLATATSASFTDATPGTPNLMRVGTNDDGSLPFNGAVSYHRLWSGVELTKTQLETEMLATAAVITANLNGDWQTPSGATRVNDSSGSAHNWTAHGTLTDETNPTLASFNPTQTVADTASGADADSGVIAATVAETPSGADASAGVRLTTIAETGSGADTASGLLANTTADTASGADAITAQTQPTAADTATGNDTASAVGAGSTADTGTGVDTPAGLIAATVADTASGADAVSTSSDSAASSSDAGSGVEATASVIGALSADTANAADLPAGFIQITLADVAFAVDLAFIGPFPPANLPYQGDAYRYDNNSGVGSISGGTVLAGPAQGSPTGSTTGATVLAGPNQGSPTGSISGGTVLPPETIL